MGKSYSNGKRNKARKHLKAEQRIARQIMTAKNVTYQEALHIMRNAKYEG